MSYVTITLSFVFYSVLGWTLDTAWRTLRRGRFTCGGFTKYPFSPIYGFGALLSLAAAPLMAGWSVWAEWFALSVMLGAFEYASGVLVVKTMKRRLWNYTEEPFDLKGHTTPFYAMAWGALALLVINVLQPMLESLFHAYA